MFSVSGGAIDGRLMSLNVKILPVEFWVIMRFQETFCRFPETFYCVLIKRSLSTVKVQLLIIFIFQKLYSILPLF